MNSKLKVLIVLVLLTTICYVVRDRVIDYVRQPLPDILVGTKSCPCDICLSESSAWFRRCINKSVEPILSTRSKLSENDFNWWRRLQHESRDFQFYRETVANLFKLFPSPADVTKPGPNHYRTCSVVGNSVNLKKSKYGQLIDSHDAVLRMNSAQVKGYEEDVGRRITHRIVYPESAVDLDNSTHLVLFPFKIQDIVWANKAFTTGFFGRSYMPVKSKIVANKNLVMVVDPAFMKYVHQVWLNGRGQYPSTGFMALILSLHICDELYVFGYGADKDGNWSHYWEPLRNLHLKTGIHPGSHEYELIRLLDKENKIHFYTGS
ncbi:CMP-N-acetylneuraminate-beta-galactosamide-alpha-2,3-sialyltransferase 1-like [Neosynchiropus ocellatus]